MTPTPSIVEKAKRLLELENNKPTDGNTTNWVLAVIDLRAKIAKELCEAVIEAEELVKEVARAWTNGVGIPGTETQYHRWLSRFSSETNKGEK